jgi:2-iminobutanoate/2-iminopropanoate deaminase
MPVPLSSAIKTKDLVFISGMAGFDMKTKKMVPGGIKSETTQALQNIATVATSAGTSMAKIVSCQVFLVNITGDFMQMNEAYEAFFPKDPPSRTAVQVASLAGGAVVEISCLAAAQDAETSVTPMKMNISFLSAAVSTSNIVFASGVQGRNGTKIVPGGPGAEARAALTGLEKTLKEAGSDMANVISCTFWFKQIGDAGAVAAAYEAFWQKATKSSEFPARMLAQAGYASASGHTGPALAGDAGVEITCMATKKSAAAPKSIKMADWKPLEDFKMSFAKTAEGMIFSSGIQGWNTTTMNLVEGGISEQTTAALKNMEAVFKAAGADLATDAVECEVFFADLGEFDKLNTAYKAFWPKTAPPARYAISAAGLSGAGDHRVEIKCTGVLSASADVEATQQIII